MNITDAVFEIEKLKSDNKKMIDMAADVIGTDTELRSSACVEVLARHCEWLRAENGDLYYEIFNLTAERDDYKGKIDAAVSLLVLEKKCTALAKERIACLESALKKYVDHFGGAHDPDCPEDDTCSCSRKALNGMVNNLLESV